MLSVSATHIHNKLSIISMMFLFLAPNPNIFHDSNLSFYILAPQVQQTLRHTSPRQQDQNIHASQHSGGLQKQQAAMCILSIAFWLIILGLLDGGPGVNSRSWLARLLFDLVILFFFNPNPKLGCSVGSTSSSSSIIPNLFKCSFCSGVNCFDLLNDVSFSFVTHVLFSLGWSYQLFFTTSVASNF